MASAAGSLFARTYAGHTGVDPYTTAVSDVYQDLFDEGIFTGKGLYDVDAFAAALEGRVPENALLSHDLFEGLYARTALVTDIEVVDDYPVERPGARAAAAPLGARRLADPVVAVSRSCRRAAGSQRNRLPLIVALEDPRQPAAQPDAAGDAGRCSCSAGPSCRAALRPGRRSAWRRSLLPLLLARCRGCVRRAGGRANRGRVFLRTTIEDLDTAAARVALQLAFLANAGLRAAARDRVTLVRLGVTRRRLLEWETAAASAGARPGPRTPRVRRRR